MHFFSGHYQCYGVNIQAICDRKCRFIYSAIAAPWCTNDGDAVKECNAIQLINILPKGYVIIGAAAYEASERLVPMYYGVHCNDEECDAFNLYASQYQIRIEMIFGLMQMKWGILCCPLWVNLNNIKYVMTAISRLHNFTIKEGLINSDEITAMEESNMFQVKF